MTNSAKTIINQALALTAEDRIAIAEQLLISLDKPDAEIDALWATEAENRLDAYCSENIKASTLEQVFSKYSKS